MTGQVIHGQSGPTAIDTHLGWVLSGPVCSQADLRGYHPDHSLLAHTSDASLMDNVLKNFWELESLDILPAEPSVYDTLKQSIKFDDGWYEVCLPWCSEETQPPSNFQLAKRRLQGLLKWLRHHPEVLQEYNAIIQDIGFNLRKFVTNSPTLRKRISEEQRLPADDEVNRSIMEEDETYTSNL